MSRFVFFALLSSFLLSCSSPEKRTKYSDKNMRIFLYPNTLKSDDYVRLQSALIKADVWSVLDRKDGYAATLREQERQHRHKSDRFSDEEKFAHWARLRGAGAVIVGHIQCTYSKSIWSSKPINKCYQALNIVDTNTGEIVVGVDGHSASPMGERPDWEEVVDKLINIYPKHFSEEKISERLNRYKLESKEEAQRQKERQQ